MRAGTVNRWATRETRSAESDVGPSSAWAKAMESTVGGASGAAGQSTRGTSSSAWQWTTSYSGNPIPAGPPVEFRPPGVSDAWNVPKESGSESFWLRNAYAELADRLRMRLRGDPGADQKIDEALRQINWLRTGEEYVETGHDLRSR